MKLFRKAVTEISPGQGTVQAAQMAVTNTTGVTHKLALISAAVLALVLGTLASGSSPADAATPGSWTGWTLNPGSGCSTAARVPFKNSSGQVVSDVAVYCPAQTWLSVRGRIRSDRTLASDVTVASKGCMVTSNCPVLFGAGTTYLNLACAYTSSTVTHGYHSDIVIFPGTQSLKLTASTSGSTTLTAHCRA